MLSRNCLSLVLSFGAVACLVLPATSAELPKEGTCHVKSKLEGNADIDKSSSVGLNGIVSWDETRSVSFDCGQTQWPQTKERCFGFTELLGDFVSANGYCLMTDEDNDKVLWKFIPNKWKPHSPAINNSSEVLMANGKYKGMSGKATSDCSFSGSSTHWSGQCDGEMTFKFP